MLNIRWFHRSGSCVSSHAPFHGRRYSGYVFFSLHLVMIMMVMAMLMVHPGMGHVLLRGRQGSLQGCSCSDQARSTSQGIIILIIIFIKINNHHHQKLHLLWLFSKQSNKFTNHPGLLRQYHCIESNCNNSIQLKKVPSLFFYFIKCTRFAGGVLQCTKPLRCWSTCRLT